LSEEALVHIPDHLSFEEAAALPCAAVTAWNALTGGRPLQAGETVLTFGSGGVSLFALQFAKLFGAHIIATTSSDDKAQRLKALGADSVINYRTTPDWQVAVRELTGGRGVDLVVDLSGGDTLVKSVQSAAVSGQISWVGWFTNSVSTIDLNAFGANIITLRRIALGSRAQFLAMNRAIAQSQLKPVIDRVFPFEDARAAYRYYEEVQPFGKVIISHS